MMLYDMILYDMILYDMRQGYKIRYEVQGKT